MMDKESERDPVEIGLRLVPILMNTLAQWVPRDNLATVGRMIDCLAGSLEIRAAEHGLARSVGEHRAAIAEKLRSLGLMPPA